ncbi:MAG: phosphate ABC transporter substrate-binding protein PstS family protein [Pisciglobus halotolerans]|nr:phosphate ABC transporter substrate-binding protein PstS family protein [Pisciglobus halotolerans]
MKKLWMSLTIASVLIFTAACGEAVEEESITAVGSSAMQPLVEAASEQYSAENLGKFVNVQGGGSGTGLSQIAAGAVDIGNSDIFAEENKGIDATQLKDHRIAVVGITPIVTPGTGVADIKIQELKEIFTGKITNWSELGGKDLPITVVNRSSGSGTRSAFEDRVLNGEKSITSQEQESSGTVRQIVTNTPGTISYVAFSYVTDEVDVLSLDGIEPNNENVQYNDWTIWSYEHMYTNGEPEGLTKDFVEYMLSDAVQEDLIRALDYIPIDDMKVERDAEGNSKLIN